MYFLKLQNDELNGLYDFLDKQSGGKLYIYNAAEVIKAKSLSFVPFYVEILLKT